MRTSLRRSAYLSGLLAVALVGGVVSASPSLAAPDRATGNRAAFEEAPPSVAAAPRRSVPAGSVLPAARRVREVIGGRSANAVVYELADGRRQAEVSSVPVHYRDTAGRWQRIDPTVRAVDASSAAGRSGYGLANESNEFGSYFGSRTDRLVRFSLGARSVSLGLPGPPRVLSPRADGNTVTYPSAVDGADLVYRVGPESLKEQIVLAAAPADPAFTFEVELAGLVPRSGPGGSIELRSPAGGPPVLVIPAPFMVDAAGVFGGASQTFVRSGSHLELTVHADAAWLADRARKYPVVVDPTIRVEPTPTQSQDVMISSAEPTRNFNDTYRLDVGTTSSGVTRSLVRFPLTNLPTGVALDSAVLQMYFDQTHTSDSFAVPVEAHRATAAWSATTATWNTANANVGELGVNQELVDDGDPGKTSQTGNWPYSTNTALTSKAVGGDYAFNRDAVVGDTYTWIPRLTESGNYRVEAHYVTASDRATSVPYTITRSGGTTSATLDQTAGGTNIGVWGQLAASVPFTAGTTGRVQVRDVTDPTKAVIVDAVRLTKDGVATKGVNQWGMWHSFSVRNLVQSWLDGTQANNGFVLKAADEAALGRGGPRYEASEFAYNGESANRPKLVLTWGRPGVELAPVTTAHATGGELSWSAYADPSPGATTPDDIVEYQVHRSVFQTFTPQASTLVTPLPAGVLSFTDTTATPAPADSPEPFGDAFYYLVAVKTRDGQLIASSTQEVRLPKAGQVFRQIVASEDTTLSSGQPDSGHDLVDGHADVGVGNLGGTFGTLRTLVKFPALTGVPAGAMVLDADVRLWSYFTAPDNDATYGLHQLTRDFDEATATWNQAGTGTAWATPGGDLAAATSTTGNFTNDPAWRSWDATALVRTWVADPNVLRAVGIRLANETTPPEETLLLSSEAVEPQLRPHLRILYTEPTTESTYFAPSTPAVIPLGQQQTVPVTLTNTTSTAWTPTGHVLSYRWTLPDGTDVTAADNRVETALPRTIAPGETVTVDAGLLPPDPPAGEEANKRIAYELTWQMEETGSAVADGSTTAVAGVSAVPVAGLKQNVAVEDPTSDQLGLEKFYPYSTIATGAGSTLSGNLYAGNAVWSYNAFSSPGRGLSTFVRLSYNSLDTSDSPMGFGWSLSTSSVMRAGSPLEFHPPGQSWPTEVSLVDGDGTTHVFRLNTHGSTDEGLWDYDHPAGVHLYLRKTGQAESARTWVMTTPDRTAFFFDDKGFQSAVADRNGNELVFTYAERRSANKPTKFLTYLTDPAARQSLTLAYYTKGEDYSFVDDTGTTIAATNLTNPKIIDRVRSITDLSGRRLEFTYTDKGLLAEMVDGAGDGGAKTFRFGYDALQGNKNVKLVRVTDPRGNPTGLAYYSPPADDPAFHWRLRTVTDRLGRPAQVAYTDPDGATGDTIATVVTDAENHATTYLMDRFGRPTEITNAKLQKTTLRWDADHNVEQLVEDNGATTTWTFDPKTGFPLQMRDAQANADGTAGHAYEYRTSLNGYVADLTAKTSPEGRRWTFGYDTVGNLLSVTDPAGTATPTAGDFTTTNTYDAFGQLRTATDANEHTTRYDDFDPNGYPRTITDPINPPTRYTYDQRGNVLTVTDPLGKTSSQNYDLFGRPTDSRVPKDQNAGVFITTPAPEYDANDNVTVATAPNGAQYTAGYDAADQITSATAPKDTPTSPQRTTAYAYDRVGNLTSTTEPNGTLTTDPNDFTTRYTYDETYQLTTVTDARGGRTAYTYDRVGNLVTTVDPRKNATTDPTDVTATYTHDLNHRVKTVTDAAGHTTSTDYDLDGLVVAATDQENTTTTITLDQRGKPAEVSVPFKDVGGTTIVATTRYTYDEVGNQTTVESPRGVATPTAGDFTIQTVYDELNRITEQLTPFDPADGRYNTANRTQYSYDPVGRLARVSAPPSAGQTVRNDTTYSYFDNGWTKSTVDPWDIATSYDYNPLGQQTSRILTSAGGSSSRAMSWSYFPDGKLAGRSDDGIPVGRQVVLVDNSDVQNTATTGTWPTATTPAGFQGFDYATNTAGTGTESFTWNLTIPQDGTYEVFVRYPTVTGAATNAPFTITHATGTAPKTVNQTTGTGGWVSLGSFEFTTTADQKITLTDAASGTVAADAVKLVRDNTADPDNERTTFDYTYDPNGNLTTITDTSPGAAVDAYTVGYDVLNQPTSVTEKLGAATAHTTTFDYDPNGNLSLRTHDGARDTYAYDERDLVSTVTNATSASDPNPKVSTYTYTPRGQLFRQVKGNGNILTRDYLPSAALRHEVETKADGTTVVAEHTLDYDLNGNRISDISTVQNADNHTAHLNRTITYTYDPLDRVATVTKTDAGTTVSSEIYVHDANNNVVSQTVAGTTTVFGYDRNRLATSTSGGITATHNYDPFGRLDTITAAGRVLKKLTYDGFDRTVGQAVREGTNTTTTAYTYDPLDRTTARTDNPGTPTAKTTTYAYLGLTDELLTEHVGTQLTKTYQYTPGGGRLSQTTHHPDGTTEDSYYGYNPHTDVEQLTDTTGDTQATYGYTAYGANDNQLFTGIDTPEPGDPTDLDPFNVYRFNNQRLDPATGDYDLGFRNYSPALNRFLTRDTYNGALADMQLGTNPYTNSRYGYGTGNPVTDIELDGHQSKVLASVGDAGGTPDQVHDGVVHVGVGNGLEAQFDSHGLVGIGGAPLPPRRVKHPSKMLAGFSKQLPAYAKEHHVDLEQATPADAIGLLEAFCNHNPDSCPFGYDIELGGTRAILQGTLLGTDILAIPPGLGGAGRRAPGNGTRECSACGGGPGVWSTVNESMSARAAAYQERITGANSGQAYVVNGVRFDGYRNGVLIDAKGPGYASFVKNGEFQPWYTGVRGLAEQARRQLNAAGGAPVTWHVAEADAAAAMQRLLRSQAIIGINIVHTP